MKHLTALPDLTALAEPYRSVVAKALEKDPEKRFRSVDAMVAALPTPKRLPPGAGRLPSSACSTYPADGPSITAVPEAIAVDEEPVWRAIRDSTAKAYSAWQTANLGTPVRVALVLVGLGVLLANVGLILPILVGFLALYGAYRLVRLLVLASLPPSVPLPPPTAHGVPRGTPPGPSVRHATHHRWRPASDEAVAALVVKSMRERLADLLASMLGSTLIVAVTCLAIGLLHGYNAEIMRPEQAAWLFLVGLVGTWAVLVPSKLWEGAEGEPILRRFTMMVLGMGVGLFAFYAGRFLWVNLTPAAGFPPPPAYQLPSGFYAVDGRPLLMAYLAVFGTLFLVIRWWRQADPLRPARLRFWSVILCVVVAGFVAGLWRFPQVWLPMVAAVMAISVQLSSPWINRHERQHGLKTHQP